MFTHPPRPVFVIGCPRSGNTLLGAILNKHPDFLIFFEINTFSAWYRYWNHRCRAEKQEPNQIFAELIQNVHVNHRFHINAEDILTCSRQNNSSWSQMLHCYMQMLLSRAKPSAKRWGDKTPHHVGHMLHIQQQYPNAQFLYVYRDPRHVVASLSKSSFRYTTNNPLVNAEVVKQYLQVYEEQKKRINQEHLLEIRYEMLVAEPEATLRQVCAFLGTNYTPALLAEADEHTRKTVGYEDDKAWNAITPQPVQIPPATGLQVESLLANWIDHYGYIRDDREPTMLRNLTSRLSTLPFRSARLMLTWFWRMKYPGFPFLMQKYPSTDQQIRWICAYYNDLVRNTVAYAQKRNAKS